MAITTLATRWPRLGLMPGFSFNDFFEPWNDLLSDEDGGARFVSMPKVNITDDKDSYKLSVAAPGLEKKDFNIDVDGNMLTISAKKEENKEEKDKTYTRREYNYSSFSRSFTLPEEVKQDKIEATYDNGVLKLTLPKSEKALLKSSKTIPIK